MRTEFSRFQSAKDLLFLPVRFILDHEAVRNWGLTSLQDERVNICLKYCQGKVLDVGCGEGNRLIKKWGNGIGVDVHPWEGIDVICDARGLPFADSEFDTATLVAVLGHIPGRSQALEECFRVLRPGGKVLITFTNSVIGFIRHKLAWWDKDLHERGMKKGEVHGLLTEDVKNLLEEAGFDNKKHARFVYGLNNLIIAQKDHSSETVSLRKGG